MPELLLCTVTRELSKRWNEACLECGHEQGHHIDKGDPEADPCELCKCPGFVPSGRAATYDTKEETSP